MKLAKIGKWIEIHSNYPREPRLSKEELRFLKNLKKEKKIDYSFHAPCQDIYITPNFKIKKCQIEIVKTAINSAFNLNALVILHLPWLVPQGWIPKEKEGWILIREFLLKIGEIGKEKRVKIAIENHGLAKGIGRPYLKISYDIFQLVKKIKKNKSSLFGSQFRYWACYHLWF